MTPGEQPPLLGGGDWSSLEGPIERFIQSWQQGRKPNIDDYLPPEVALRAELILELAHTDLELRLKAGEFARVEDYLARYPELAADRSGTVSLIASEYDLRRRAQPNLEPDEYLRRFPQYGDELALRLGTPTVLDQRKAGTRRAEPPPEVPGYEVLEELGRGGMGVVYRARQLSLNRPVALKFLPAECALDPLWLARFRHEARTASNLNHPNVCTIYDTGQSAGRPFLSMELVQGRTLDALAREQPSLANVIHWTSQVARALSAAHAAGVVHRDIKPANVMVRDDGLVKVLDFGLARRLPGGSAGVADEPGGPSTDPGTFVGTPAYVSPEQARAEPVGTPSDIFSLGVVLYELATGRHPFETATPGLLYALQTINPVAPARLNPEISSPLSTLIERMLAKLPAARPSAADVASELARLASGSPDPSVNQTRTLAPKRLTIGRRDELAALRRAFDEAMQGRGSFVCLTGEPGIGKTTLIESFLDELTAVGLPYAKALGRCSERLAGAEAYLPFLEALDDLLQGDTGSSSAALMKHLAPAWYAQLAPIANGAHSAGTTQERLKREFATFLTEVSRDRTLVLVLDDLHWADPSSIDLLAYLGGKCATMRVLVVLTYRPTDMILGKHPFVAVRLELQGRGVCREIALPLFSSVDLSNYLDEAFTHHRFPDDFIAAVHARTGGNPLYVTDLMRYLRDRRVVVQNDGGWVVARQLPDFSSDLPESVRSMIQRTVDQLDASDHRILTAASVQGSEFDAMVVSKVLGRDPAEVEERLEVLERVHGLVRLLREHEFPDRTLTLRYTFVHALYQDALYASLQPTRKATWSASAAQTLLSCYGIRSAEVAANLALLFEAARDLSSAIAHFQVATRKAVAVSAHAEAVSLARRGLALIERLPVTAERTAQELEMLQALGVSLVATQGFASPEVERTYLRAQQLCEGSGDRRGLFPVLYGLWNVYLLRGELTRCTDLASCLFSKATDLADPVFLMQAHNVLQQPLLHQGELAAARQHQERGLALYREHRHSALTAVFGEDPGVGCLTYSAMTLWAMGYQDQSLRSLEEARRLAAELGNPFDAGRALYFAAFTHLCRGDVARVAELASELRELSDENGFAMLRAGSVILSGWSEAEASGEDPAKMRRGLNAWKATGALSHRPYHLALLAKASAKSAFDEALRAADEALALCDATGERFLEAELHRLRGEVLLAGGAENIVAAQTCYARAAAVARRQAARSLELRALVSLARLHERQGRVAEVLPQLAEVFGWFTEGFDTPDLRQAKSLMDAAAQ